MNNKRVQVKGICIMHTRTCGLYYVFLMALRQKACGIHLLTMCSIKISYGLTITPYGSGQQVFQSLPSRNTLIFSFVGVGLLLIVSLALSMGLIRLDRRYHSHEKPFFLPMLLPTVSVIFSMEAGVPITVCLFCLDEGWWRPLL